MIFFITKGVMYLYRMLIADHDEVFLSVAERVFSADFEIETCQDGETALQLLSTFQPQVLILNLSLPGKDGITYTRRSGVALETQYYPNALNNPEWDQPITPRGEHYHSETVYRFY